MIPYYMTRKIKDLEKDLIKAGFIKRTGKGNHRNYKHPKGIKITISGKPNSDAHYYQEKQVKKSIEKVKK